jgi:hypothetical protein
MEPMAVAGMVFVLVLCAMVGGFILLMPLSRRLGLLIDAWVQDKRGGAAPGELAELRRSIQLLEAEVSSLAERQQFTDQLLQTRARERLDPPAER